ncbi:MAG: epoxyqueuosine reductase QueH [Desulfobacterales bacterium]|nr:epoxyqueuosine reductase QueH [Desulfobacterales bacterium]
MKILLHICCAPCSIVPIQDLREEGFDVRGFFYRHNIHPYLECLKRQETLQAYAEMIRLNVIYQKNYDLNYFLQQVVFRESNRCSFCYHDRLKSTALMAKRGKFDCFTTTLLYSRFQNHDLIRSVGESIGQATGVAFLYRDFREKWKAGVDESKRLKMYRQSYCGCIFSERERFYPARRAAGMREH